MITNLLANIIYSIENNKVYMKLQKVYFVVDGYFCKQMWDS